MRHFSFDISYKVKRASVSIDQTVSNIAKPALYVQQHARNIHALLHAVGRQGISFFYSTSALLA